MFDDVDPTPQLVSFIEDLRKECTSVSGFSTSHDVVVANFSYLRMPMVRDLQGSHEAIMQHELVSGIAGDESARVALSERIPALELENLQPVPAPEDEYLILDADSSQSWVIAAAVRGADLAVIGPPGTGKSQTIANLIASMIARGKSVLFVAEKRAAINAVVKRLSEVSLGDLILDMHDRGTTKKQVAAQLQAALSKAGSTLPVDASSLSRQLTHSRTLLDEYVATLHEPLAPWGVSPFDVQCALLDLEARARSDLRLSRNTLASLDSARFPEARDRLHRFVELGGIRLLQDSSPWAAALRTSGLGDAEAVEDTLDQIHELLLSLPKLGLAIDQACGSCGLAQPANFRGFTELLDLFASVETLLDRCAPTMFELNLEECQLQLERGRGWFKSAWLRTFSVAYRRALADARGCMRNARANHADMTASVEQARRILGRWRAMATDSATPNLPNNLGALRDQCTAAVAGVEGLSGVFEDVSIADMSFDDLVAFLQSLNAARRDAIRLPEIQTLRDMLVESGLGEFLASAGKDSINAEDTTAQFEHAWYASIRDYAEFRVPSLSDIGGGARAQQVRAFEEADSRHIRQAPKRIRRAWAQRAVAVREAFPQQEQLVKAEATKKRRHRPIRELFREAPDVLTAVKTCWVMSPLVVSEVLPREQCFDLVIFDEASQIPPADAVSSLLRGYRAVVAGDPKQLPPTRFFLGTDDDDDLDDVDDDDAIESKGGAVAIGVAQGRRAALVEDIESVLDVAAAILPAPVGTRTLQWHYRSKDERLIAFSNSQELLYDSSLVTFPGTNPDGCLRFELVSFPSGYSGPLNSVSDEVTRVVELILHHASDTPSESLGVIAFGSKHAERIEAELHSALLLRSDLHDFFDDSQSEPFFVKNIERVQGDERDAIILTVGYAKHRDGRMRYVFGPLNQEGGERRLNVAVTRARSRLTLVSSFGAKDMDPNKLTSAGAKMLRDYMAYVESDGQNIAQRTQERPELNPFERDVLERLRANGMNLVPQYGASGYRIDFAVMHPKMAGLPILAIETDGRTYHSSASARDRDRLRQQQLERQGWRFHRIWSTEWVRNREEEIERALQAYRAAVEAEANTPITSGPSGASAEPDTSKSSSIVRPPRPRIIHRGWPITEYTNAQLRQIVQWVESDGRLRTKDELLAECAREMGYSRKGNRIVARLSNAIDQQRLRDSRS